MNTKNLGEDADDEDDDEEEEEFPSNLLLNKLYSGLKFSKDSCFDYDLFFSQGKLLREKESRKGDWKQRISKGIKNASETLKKHANKVSYRVQRWWRGIKAARSKASKAEL